MDTKTITLSVEQWELIQDLVASHNDAGPSGEGWQSDKLLSANMALTEALECHEQNDNLVQEHLDLKRQIKVLENKIDDIHDRWSKDIPNDQGLWWWWNQDEDSAPIAISVTYSGTSGDYFASIGQYGWTEPQNVAEMGGFWMRLHEPSPP